MLNGKLYNQMLWKMPNGKNYDSYYYFQFIYSIVSEHNPASKVIKNTDGKNYDSHYYFQFIY